MIGPLIRIIIYFLIVMAPLGVLAFTTGTYYGFLSELGRSAAIAGFMMLLLQPILSGRFKWINRPFGFDVVIRYHKNMALFSVLLVILHPFLLGAGDAGFQLIFSTDQAWYITVGKLTMLILVVSVGISLFGVPDRFGFERWRVIHDVLFPLVLAGGFVHSWYAGTDLLISWMRWLWIIAAVSSLAAYIYHRFLRPRLLSRKPYRVSSVNNAAPQVWDIRLAPPEGEKVFSYLPGQFQFITFHRREGLPEEEHHWTISSSPTEEGSLGVTIKELGDFTSTMGETRSGDTATVHAPFGRFSYVLHPEEKDFVFIAGGIGITPVMSMLRHMRDTDFQGLVLLVYANRNLESAVFREEIAEMERTRNNLLRVIHVLSSPGEGWNGETGRIDSEKLEKYCEGEFEGKAFYVCGPGPLVQAVVGALEGFGVPGKSIHTEIFSFLD